MKATLLYHCISILIFSLSYQSCLAQKKNKMNGISAKEILLLAEGQKAIHISNTTIQDDLDFTKIKTLTPVNESFSQYMINQPVYFHNCRFKGKVIFSSQEKNIFISGKALATISFENCSFDEDVFAKSLDVSGMLSLQGSTFSKLANWEDINVHHDANFSRVIFNGEARFQNAVFKRRLQMLRSEFSKNVSFQGASFGHDAQFSDVKFLAYCDFGICHFHQSAFFNYSVFQTRAIFNQCIFGNRAEWNKSKLHEAEWKNTQFRGACSFIECAISGKADFQKVTYFVQKPNISDIQIEKERLTVNEVESLNK